VLPGTTATPRVSSSIPASFADLFPRSLLKSWNMLRDVAVELGGSGVARIGGFVTNRLRDDAVLVQEYGGLR
jgi:hypothetical protein